MYEMETRVRFSESGANNLLKIESLIDYFQDCATFHSEDLGIGVKVLKERHLVWVISSWQVDVVRMPAYGEKITIATWPYGFKGFIGYRNLIVKDSDNNIIVSCNSIWSLISTDTFLPAYLEKEMADRYPIEPKLDMDYAPRKIVARGEWKECEKITVQPHHLDVNGHVNNGQYIRMALECIPDVAGIKRLRTEYRLQTMLHEVLTPRICREESVTVVDLVGEDGKSKCVVEVSS